MLRLVLAAAAANTYIDAIHSPQEAATEAAASVSASVSSVKPICNCGEVTDANDVPRSSKY